MRQNLYIHGENMPFQSRTTVPACGGKKAGFTLIELLVVIAIIVLNDLVLNLSGLGCVCEYYMIRGYVIV